MNNIIILGALEVKIKKIIIKSISQYVVTVVVITIIIIIRLL